MKMQKPIVFDVDGTLTVPDLDKGLLDALPNKGMVQIARSLQASHPLIISTARSESLRFPTASWLKRQGIYPRLILMRPSDQADQPDHEVKFRHLRRIQKQYGQPQLWADDKNSNIEMLRENNVPVVHVK